MRRANGLALFAVGVALEVVLRPLHRAGSVQHQRLAAIRAEHQSREDVRLVHVLGDTLFVLTHLLHDVPLLLRDKGFVGVLHHEPLTLGALHALLVFVGDRNISGKLSDERFIKLSRDYELEQTNLTNLVEHLRQEVKEQEKQKVNVRQFIAAVRKYTDMQQLDASILREFVDKIYISEVYTPDENEPRIKVREIEIVYNFIGAFDFEEAREQSQAAQKEKKTGVA